MSVRRAVHNRMRTVRIASRGREVNVARDVVRRTACYAGFDWSGGAAHGGQRLHRVQPSADAAQDVNDVPQGEGVAVVDVPDEPQVGIGRTAPLRWRYVVGRVDDVVDG